MSRSTLYENLAAYKDGGDCVLLVYRNTSPGKIDPETNRRYGETGQSERVQLEADRKWDVGKNAVTRGHLRGGRPSKPERGNGLVGAGGLAEV